MSLCCGSVDIIAMCENRFNINLSDCLEFGRCRYSIREELLKHTELSKQFITYKLTVGI